MDKRKNKSIVSGEASATGFIIRQGAIKVSSRNYSNKFSARMLIKSIIIFLLCFAAYIFLFFLYALISDSPYNSRVLRIFLFLGGAVFILAAGLFMNKRTKQWHACEHKGIKLIEQNIEPTMDNLKKISPLDPNCSSVMASALSLAFLIISALLIFINLSLGFCLLIFWLAFEGFNYLFSKTRIPILPYLIQYLVIKEPTQEQLEATLRVGKEFLKKYQEFPNGSLK